MNALPDFADPPFAVPTDIVLDLPPPVSVNRSRKIDWRGHKKVAAWKDQADRFLLIAKARKEVRFDKIPRFEIVVVLSEDHVDADADNILKLLIDYLRHCDIVADDAKHNMRRIVVEWGHAPAGCRVIVRPMEG